MKPLRSILPGLALAASCLACQDRPAADGGAANSPAAAPATASEDGLPPAPEATPLPADLEPFIKPFKGDFDGMVKRRVIRVLTVQNPLFYFVDRGREM